MSEPQLARLHASLLHALGLSKPQLSQSVKCGQPSLTKMQQKLQISVYLMVSVY